VFVENPLGRKPPGVKSPPHQRTPSDVGLMEMADFVHKQSWAPPADARDVTALPSPTGADGETTPTKGGTPRDSVNGGVPSPWKRSAGGLGENWVDKVERVRTNSPYGNFPGWSLKPVIIKAGDNCRQELLAIQLARVFQRIYSDAGLPLWLRPFEVIATSTTSAFIEAVTDAPSIHAIKSRAPRGTSLRQHFEAKFGGGGTAGFRVAQRNFVESLAGYSILTYVLQVKDRHNGNILLSDDGHLIHIDFNFMLSTSPGGINFESSPFKLTREYLEVMDSDDAGIASEAFNYYKVLCIQGYLALRRHAERILLLVEMMSASGTPCFKAGPKVLNNLRKRFNLGKTEEQCVEIMLSMISDSIDAWCTRQYDFYQRVLNGIL
jgi:phosphatidylinositol 4-kinase